MKTNALIISVVAGALAVLPGQTAQAAKHDIKMTHSHSPGKGLEWTVDKYNEKVTASGDTVTWKIDGNAMHPAPPFWIVVRTNEAKWTPPGTNVFEVVTNAPFSDGTYWCLQSQTNGYDQVLSLQIQSLTSTPDKTVPVRYYVIAEGDLWGARSNQAGHRTAKTVGPLAIPYYFYMADAMVVWE
jgi:hypothetical protein